MSRTRARVMMNFQLIFMVLVVESFGKVDACRRRDCLPGRRGKLGSALASDKAQNVTVKKLTRKNPTMAEKFDELGRGGE